MAQTRHGLTVASWTGVVAGLSAVRLPMAWCFALWVLGASLIGHAHAATFAVVLSDDTAPYQETADALEASLGSEHTVIRILASHLAESETALNSARQVVSVGVKATRLVAARASRTPILAVLIPRTWYESAGKPMLSEGGRAVSAIFVDQPLGRQLHLIRAALPSVNRVGVVLGRETTDQLPELEKQAKAHRMSLVSAILDNRSRLVEALEEVLEEAEVLLLPFPDAEVLTRTSAQSIFMTSYRFRDPVVGYSQSLAKAGALLAVYSTPAQIGRQAAEVLVRSPAGDRSPAGMWPQYFSISVNPHVARALDIRLAAEAELLKRVQEAESHDHD